MNDTNLADPKALTITVIVGYAIALAMCGVIVYTLVNLMLIAYDSFGGGLYPIPFRV